MNSVFRRVFPVVFLHVAVGFIVALFISLRENAGSAVLPPFASAFNMHNAFIRFTGFFPALIISALLTGYALTFRTLVPEKVGRWSSKLLPELKRALIFSLVLTCAYVILAEGVVPTLKNEQHAAIIKTDSYNDYMSIYRTENTAGNLQAALANAEAALAIWRESPEAEEAAVSVRMKIAEFYGIELEEAEVATNAINTANATLPFPESGYTSHELLEKAQRSAEDINFYNAHYYAALSWRIADQDAPYKESAISLASESWSRITEALDGIRAEPERRYYERKLKGYNYIQEGDFLSAYYHFLDMSKDEEIAGAGRDPDIAKFLEIARQGLMNAFFFVDETENLGLFEETASIFFTLPNGAGGRDAVFADAISRMDKEGNDCAYLRNFELARFDSNNRLSFHIVAPYAKILPIKTLGGAEMSQVILTSVNKNTNDVKTDAEVIEGNFPPQNSLSDSILILDMPYQDINILVNASSGPSLMTLPELITFARRSEHYGLQNSAYLAEFVQRVSYPFAIFAIAIFAITCAWQFRLRKNRPFSAWWIIVFPLITIVCMYVILAARYALNLCITLVSLKAPMLAIPCTAIIIILALFAASAYFFAQRSD